MVLFDDGSSSTIPVTRIVEPASRILKVGETVEVQWSDKAIYEATIQALGNQKDMEELIDALQGEEGSADEEDHETDEEIQKVKSVPMTSKVCEKEKHVDTKKAKKKEALLSSASFIEIKSQQLQLADIKHLIMSTQPQNNKYPEIGLDAGRAESSLSELKPTGCWLGNPAATDAKQRVWTTRTTPDKLASAEFTAKNAPKLALNLMWALFSDDELVNGCCTPSPSGYKILDQTIIGGIRMHINYKFPASSLDDEKIRWKSILQGNMNAKCRSLRSRSPKFVKVQPTVFDATHDDGGCRAGLRDAAHDDGGCHAVLTDESEDTAAPDGFDALLVQNFVLQWCSGTLSVGQVLQSRPQALHSSWIVVLSVISAAASLPSMRRTALLGEPPDPESDTDDIVISVFINKINPDKSFGSSDPMCILLLQLSSLLVEHTAPNIHDSNKSVQIQMCSVAMYY
eukprot:Em0003g918a